MSGLLKARAIGAASARRIEASDPILDDQVARLRRHVASLEAGIAARDTRILELGAGLEQAYLEGEAAGLAQAQDDVAERHRRLEAAIATAQARLTDVFAETGRLAALIARECLAKVLDPAEDRARLVVDLLRNQLSRLEGEAVLAVEVSAADFRKEDTRQLTMGSNLSGAVELNFRDDLPSGACVIALRVGRLEVGIGQQWGAVAAVLDEFAAVGRSA
jgi:flagellar biosynthesis/type III secretory pathway protein FliH